MCFLINFERQKTNYVKARRQITSRHVKARPRRICELIPRPTDGHKNQTLARPSKSTHSGALQLTFQGLQMDPSLVP